MKHRLCDFTGFGSNAKVMLDNRGELNQEFASDVIETYFPTEKFAGVDYQVRVNYVAIGVEPTYQYDQLKIIKICREKRQSFIQHGRAFGPYGSDIASKKKTYDEYKTKGKFVKFVDKWHPILFPGGVKLQ